MSVRIESGSDLLTLTLIFISSLPNDSEVNALALTLTLKLKHLSYSLLSLSPLVARLP
jgi:hypothetical protein